MLRVQLNGRARIRLDKTRSRYPDNIAIPTDMISLVITEYPLEDALEQLIVGDPVLGQSLLMGKTIVAPL